MIDLGHVFPEHNRNVLAVIIDEQKFSSILFCIKEHRCLKQNSGSSHQFLVEQLARHFAAEYRKINN